MALYQHLLVGLDLSDESGKIIQHAKALAKTFSAELSIANVIEPLALSYGGDIPIELNETQTVIEQHAQKRLGELVSKHGLHDTQTYLPIGSPATELKELAKEIGADLIVVGTHGRHGLALLLGSTSNGVLHGTECDVLAVKV